MFPERRSILEALLLHHGAVAPSTNHDVIEYGNPQHAPGVHQLSGHRTVLLRRRRVTRRMIVYENQRSRSLPHGGSEDFARVDERRVQDATRHERFA